MWFEVIVKTDSGETLIPPAILRPIHRMSKTFGVPWPDFNDGLTYNDVVSASDSGRYSSLCNHVYTELVLTLIPRNWLFCFHCLIELTLIDYYSSKHKNSAPLQGYLYSNPVIEVFFMFITRLVAKKLEENKIKTSLDGLNRKTVLHLVHYLVELGNQKLHRCSIQNFVTSFNFLEKQTWVVTVNNM